MKRNITKGFWLIAIAFATLATACSGSEEKQTSQRSATLVVEEQMDSVVNVNGDGMVTIIVDVPVDGPQALTDSVMALLNDELYQLCEMCCHIDSKNTTFKEEEVFTNDANLLGHYMEKYRPTMKDSVWNLFTLTGKMEAQTDAYVTYGFEHHHCGGSCGSEKYYVTFDKNDGHQVRDILSRENLVRFFADYPEYSSIEDYAWQFSPEHYASLDYDPFAYGLLEDNFSLVVMGWSNHYFTVRIPYGQIFSYLSPEAQKLVEQKGENMPMLPSYLPGCSKYDEFMMWMRVDTTHHALLRYTAVAGGEIVDTMTYYEPGMEIYPKGVYYIDGANDAFLFLYSRGHIMYYDEAVIYAYGEQDLQPTELFVTDGKRESEITCMWYDQVVEATEGFPFDQFDEDRFGIHYDQFTKQLYVPFMDYQEKGSEFEGKLRYTGRYDVYKFNGKEFVHTGTDGAWWLRSDLRNYQRTVSNKKTAEGYEQIDLMPDGTYRRTVWKGAKTLDDLRKKPDEVKISKQMNF